MANTTPASKAFAVGNRHVRVMAAYDLGANGKPKYRPIDSRNAKQGAPDSHAANPIPVCSHRGRRCAMSCGRAAHCLWMDRGCGCADSANHIT
jgi:hypothetical protein